MPLQVPDDDTTEQNKTTADNTDKGSVLLVKPDNATTETNSPAEQEKTESDSTLPVSESDVTAQSCQNEETLGVTTTPSPLPKLETSKEQTDAMETTTEQIIGEISYMEHSDDFHSVKSSSDVPSNFKLVETSSVISELPEFSHTLDTTVTNNTNGSSGSFPPQGTGSPDNNNIDTTDSSGSSRTKWRQLKTCVIRLTELSNQEREQWMSGTSQTTSTPSLTSSSYDGSSASTNDSRYNMCVRLQTPVTQSTGRKRASVNYAEQGTHDSGCDSDYKAKLKPQQPRDNKSYPSVSQIATQQVIKTNRASKQTMMPNTIALPAATEPLQGPVQANKQTTDNSVLPETTNDVGALSIPDKTDGNNSDLPDETITQPKNVLPDATHPQSPDATKDSTAEPKQSVDETASRNTAGEKPVKGMFKTKTITIRRSKDPHTFKCSVCSTRALTLKELNAHFIQNHQNVDCDMCGKSFLTPVSLRKHHYSHIEESEQFQCRTCDKHFPFESQLKSHRHMHRRTRYYSCASANCECSFRHPGDLAAHARSHGKPYNCAHCSYSNTDIRNLCSHMRVHSREAPFTCKMCGQKFVHSNQLVRHKPKCPKNPLKQEN